MDILGLQADYKSIVTHKVSDNLTRLVFNTPKGNGYAVYHYKDDDKMFANWKREHIHGADKAYILELMEKKMR